MASRFEWIKLLLENVKVVIPIIILLLSTLGWTINDNMNKEKEIAATKKKVVEDYHKKKVEIKCPDCTSIKDHEQEYHR